MDIDIRNQYIKNVKQWVGQMDGLEDIQLLKLSAIVIRNFSDVFINYCDKVESNG